MTAYRPKRPAWDAAAEPRKLKCPSGHVYGWLYPDGAVELVCRERGCRKPGMETRHVWLPELGQCVDQHVAREVPAVTAGEE